jgi:hypothetical protein
MSEKKRVVITGIGIVAHESGQGSQGSCVRSTEDRHEAMLQLLNRRGWQTAQPLADEGSFDD